MKKKNFKLGYIIIICILLAAIIAVFLKIPVRTVQAVYSTYEDRIGFKGFYFVDEHVIYNESTKELNLKYKDGDLVSKGSKLSANIVASEAGMVINHLDGYENKYNRSNIKNITTNEISSMLNNKKKTGIKIVNNSVWYICGNIDSNMSKYIKKGMAKDISIDNKYYAADIIDVFKNNSGSFVLMRLKNDLDVENLSRGIEGSIIRTKYNAMVIPENSIIEYNGEVGVFVKLNGYAEFRKVKIITRENENVVVVPAEKSKPELMEYDDVICRPAGLEDGEKL